MVWVIVQAGKIEQLFSSTHGRVGQTPSPPTLIVCHSSTVILVCNTHTDTHPSQRGRGGVYTGERGGTHPGQERAVRNHPDEGPMEGGSLHKRYAAAWLANVLPTSPERQTAA